MRRAILLVILLVGFVAVSSGTICRADGSLDDMLTRIPAHANTILVIDVPALHKSPLGVREE